MVALPIRAKGCRDCIPIRSQCRLKRKSRTNVCAHVCLLFRHEFFLDFLLDLNRDFLHVEGPQRFLVEGNQDCSLLKLGRTKASFGIL